MDFSLPNSILRSRSRMALLAVLACSQTAVLGAAQETPWHAQSSAGASPLTAPFGKPVGSNDSGGGLSVLTNPTWAGGVNPPIGWFGRAVSGAGDVNGDGYADVIVGARLFDNGELDEGGAFVYHGSPTGLELSPSWSDESNEAGADFGYAVSGVGDVNADGFDDILVSAPRFDGGFGADGGVYLYLGSAVGLQADPAWSMEPNAFSALFGWSLSGAGDVDGDGYDDVIIGEWDFGSGIATLYHGSSSGLETVPGWKGVSRQGLSGFGTSVSGAGDVDGDGYDDVIIGEPGYSFGGAGNAGEGRALLFRGGADGLSPVHSWAFESNVSNAGLGGAVAGAGDVNGDGFADVVVGASRYYKGESREGAAFVFHGSPTGLLATPSFFVESNQVWAHLGAAVSTAGDVNGDGYDDILVGAPQFDAGETDEGRAFLFLGGHEGVSALPAWWADSNRDLTYFGTSTAAAGDIDGDGLDDLIVGGHDLALVFHGTGTASSMNYCTAGISADGCTALISGTGTASASMSSGFRLNAVRVDSGRSGLFFFGTNGRQVTPWGNGSSLQCVVPPVQRTPILGGGGTGIPCTGTFSLDVNSLWCPSCPNPTKNPGAGAVVQTQLWYRDPLNTSNQSTALSDAVEFSVQP